MPDPGPERWMRAEIAYKDAIIERNQNLRASMKNREGRTGAQIAKEYGMSRAYAYELVRGKR